jgi:hypothetical protein
MKTFFTTTTHQLITLLNMKSKPRSFLKPVGVVIHMYMEAMIGISLYSYLNLKLAKMLCLSYYLLCFLFNKIEEGRTGSAWK